jgi:hypothetical protein
MKKNQKTIKDLDRFLGKKKRNIPSLSFRFGQWLFIFKGNSVEITNKTERK